MKPNIMAHYVLEHGCAQMDIKENYDMDNDGRVTDEDIRIKSEVVDLENRDKREDQQRRMAWVAMLAMLAVTGFLFTPAISPERVAALSDLLSMFYIAQAGVVASFFGAQAFMSVNRS